MIKENLQEFPENTTPEISEFLPGNLNDKLNRRQQDNPANPEKIQQVNLQSTKPSNLPGISQKEDDLTKIREKFQKIRLNPKLNQLEKFDKIAVKNMPGRNVEKNKIIVTDRKPTVTVKTSDQKNKKV